MLVTIIGAGVVLVNGCTAPAHQRNRKLAHCMSGEGIGLSIPFRERTKEKIFYISIYTEQQ
jgi:hypothetical protein